VAQIDQNVRRYVVPVFTERIKEYFGKAQHIGFFEIADLLGSAWEQLSGRFGEAKLSQLSLKLNPSRIVALNSKDTDMVYFSEKFECAATHKLWNDDFSEEKNFEVFGKCANPTGHGHNYVIEVTIKIPDAGREFRFGDFERIVDVELVKLLDHKNLNLDVDHFKKTNPTVENIASFAWHKLAGKFGRSLLHCVSVWENDKTFCSYFG
jgi:6-pyruvoyltetrahydropterin/6-carboxytetrahydropterin synthase